MIAAFFNFDESFDFDPPDLEPDPDLEPPPNSLLMPDDMDDEPPDLPPPPDPLSFPGAASFWANMKARKSNTIRDVFIFLVEFLFRTSGRAASC